ncbi:MAG: hypothetical protein K2P28_04340 [Lachnospiraceae bacterium]|nr:hypothetical protein [Lachnospiraceae bacterium]
MREDRESGRGRENERGRKSMGTGGYEMEELVPIVAKLAEQYTGHESTSVTYEKANQLMTAVMYCIHEYEMSGQSGAVSASNISAKEAYELGGRLVDEKVRDMKERYHSLLGDFCSYGNTALEDTVTAVPEFLKWYDMKYEPQNTILTLDYPLLVDLAQYTGIDAVWEYVRCIAIEQRFMNQFPETYVVNVLRAYEEEYEKLFENLCGILLRDVAGHILLKKSFDNMALNENDYGKIQAILCMYSKEEAKRLVWESVRSFLERFYKDDGEIWSYVEAECANIVVRIRHTVL